MSSYFSSLYNYITSYLSPQEQQYHQDPHITPQPHPANPAPQTSPRNHQQQQQLYPQSPTDIHKTISHLTHASPTPLPPEILKQILFHASYDCITYTAASKTQVNAIARSATGPPARACVSSPPLSYLGPSIIEGEKSTTVPGRIRSLRLSFTGRDQGWTSDPSTSSWSWFEIGKISSSESKGIIQRGPVLAHNTIAGQDWRDFEILYHIDGDEKSIGVNQELRDWIQGLQREDQVVIIPMARFAGWQCRVLKARVEVEIEVWY